MDRYLNSHQQQVTLILAYLIQVRALVAWVVGIFGYHCLHQRTHITTLTSTHLAPNRPSIPHHHITQPKLSQACHELVPPEEVHPLLKHVANAFVAGTSISWFGVEIRVDRLDGCAWMLCAGV